MSIDATAAEIRMLLQLAELDEQAQALPPDTLRTRREAGRRRVTRALLERYQMLLEVGRHPAIVAIERGVCSGCHVRLPTMVEYQARRLLAVHTCPHCRRMLYVAELLSQDSSRRTGSQNKAIPRRSAPPALRPLWKAPA